MEYETKTQDNSIDLLKLIRILMYKPERSKYPFVSRTEAFKHVVSMKQKDNEILLNYSKRLKQAKDILESHVGEDILGPQIERNGI